MNTAKAKATEPKSTKADIQAYKEAKAKYDGAKQVFDDRVNSGEFKTNKRTQNSNSKKAEPKQRAKNQYTLNSQNIKCVFCVYRSVALMAYEIVAYALCDVDCEISSFLLRL